MKDMLYQYFKNITDFITLHYKRVLLYGALVVAGAIALYAIFALLRAPFVLYLPPAHTAIDTTTYRLFDGHEVGETDDEFTRPFAVIIENHVDSRPVAGLEDASVVYETIVEGDITRYLALFASTVATEKIGPIRSARPFFVDIAEEWDAPLFHAGGSPEALAQLKQSTLPNINEISADGIYFWRDVNRERPHNLFSSSTQITRAFNAKSIATTTEALIPWQFTSNQDFSELTATSTVIIPFYEDPNYIVRFEYDADSNKYTRYLGGKVHKTASGIILKADTVVVQHVDSVVIDDYGRRSIELTGRGDADIYQNGTVVNGVWRNYSGRTKYYDQSGVEVAFNRGVTWIALSFK